MNGADDLGVSRVRYKRLWRAVAVFSALIAVAVVIAILAATWPHLRIRLSAGRLTWEDSFTLLLPVVIPMLSLIACILTIVTPPKSWLLSGALAGFFVGSTLFLILPMLALITQYELITNDGTTHWALLFLPSFWVGLPLVLGGTVVGSAVNAIGRHRNGISRKWRRWFALCSVCAVGIALVVAAICCVSVRRHMPITHDTRLSLVDATTGESVQDADVFLITILEAYGHGPFWESPWQDVHYEYSGHQEMPYLVPVRQYRTVSYNYFLWGRRPARCYTAALLYKRGYLTTVWVPEKSTKIALLRMADSNMRDKGIGEGEIDWLLEWSCLTTPDRSRFYWTREDALLGYARVIQRYVSSKSDFRRIAKFAIAEYQFLLDTVPSLDETTRHRLSEKIKGLSGMIELEQNAQ